MLIGVSLLAAVFVAASLWFWQEGRLELKSWLGAFALVAWVVGVGIKVHLDGQRESPAVAALPNIAWPSDRAAVGARAPDAAAPLADGSAPVQVAPVSSLVGGLEQRLAAQPDDVNGWALLAQSYAFMGDAAAARRSDEGHAMLGSASTADATRDAASRSKCTLIPTPTTQSTSTSAPSQLFSSSRPFCQNHNDAATNTAASRLTPISMLAPRAPMAAAPKSDAALYRIAGNMPKCPEADHNLGPGHTPYVCVFYTNTAVSTIRRQPQTNDAGRAPRYHGVPRVTEQRARSLES